jgi:hypothetical protein
MGDFIPFLINSRRMQLQIDFVGKRSFGLLILASPRFPEHVVSIPAALGTWPLPGGEGHGLIEEEKLGITVQGHDHPVTTSEFQNARDPAPAFVGSDYFPVGIMQRAAAVAHHLAANIELPARRSS